MTTDRDVAAWLDEVAAARDVASADDLDAAADVIDARGWCQNKLADPDGRVCAEGAILAAVTGAEKLKFGGVGTAAAWLDEVAAETPEGYLRYGRRIRWALGVLRDHLFRSGAHITSPAIYHWNDRDGMTRDEVTDMFRRAAKDARERAGGAS